MKRIFSLFLIFFFWCEFSFALSQKEAIERYLSGRKLDSIEGIWIADRGRVAVFYKQGSNYFCKAIRSNQINSGQTYCNLTKGSDRIYYGRMFEGGADVQLDVTVSLNRTSFRYFFKGVQDSYSHDRIWPSDIIAYNKNFSKPKKQKPKIDINDDKIVPAGSGSGFFVSSNGTIITNHHVIEGCNSNNIFYKGVTYESEVLSVDKVNDIAILKTNITPDRVFSVSNEDVSLLEDVVVAGYPLGKQVSSAIKTHKGVVTALAGAGDNYSNFQTDASINQGNSGGPILDQKGNVVGIAVATWVEEGVQGVHFGIKSSTLKTFASANGLKFLPANNRDLSNKDLGTLIMQSTVYVECHMTIASIKKMIAEAENKKAFFKEFE